MFSKELLELDRNTVQYMIDEMQEEIDKKQEQLMQQEEQLSRQNQQISHQEEQLHRQNQQISQAKARQIAMLQNAMKNFNLTAEDAMDALGLPNEDREELMKKLL